MALHAEGRAGAGDIGPHAAPGKARSLPELLGSYLLQGPDGRVVSSDQPTLLETDGKRAVRRIVLAVDGLDEGPYTLAITVEDRLARHTLSARVPFSIESALGTQITAP